MSITASDVNKLRQITGAGMMDCKKALTEAEGDFEKAIDILRKQGQKVANKRADNETKEGLVVIALNQDATNAKLLAVACETEPVSKVENFRELVQHILDTAVAHNPANTEELLALTLADGRVVNEAIIELTGKIGEKVVIAAYENVSGEKMISYIHSTGKLGVLVALKNVNGADTSEAGKDVALQIASMRPIALDKEDISADVIEREIEIGKEQARGEGKPEAMLEKIAMGKLNKFYKDSTLLNQEFVKDSSKTIAQMLDGVSKGLTVSAFRRIQIGG
ncbi:MAG: elongation factor Ts [Verrucomicrobia bacterium]|nr:elongation factor Ts [Cytophagales bacterium]